MTRRRADRAVFPTKARSFWLTWGNLIFPVWNTTFATLLGTFYWLMTWMYSQTQIIGRKDCVINGLPEGRPLVEDILVVHRDTCGLKGFGDLVAISIQSGIYQFLLGIFALLLLVTLIFYADSRARWKKVLLGTMHWLAHLTTMVALYILVNRFGYWTYLGDWTYEALYPFLGAWIALLRTGIYMTQMIVIGGMAAGFVWGFYLFTCCAFGKRHWNEAFSSLRIPDYKNFLRMKIERDRLTIYPIGVERVPTRLGWRPGKGVDEGKFVPLLDLKPFLIDGPIVIDAKRVRRNPAFKP